MSSTTFEREPPALADVRDALAGIAAVAALLSGARPSEVDRTAVARLIQLKAECAALKLERLAPSNRIAGGRA